MPPAIGSARFLKLRTMQPLHAGMEVECFPALALEAQAGHALRDGVLEAHGWAKRSAPVAIIRLLSGRRLESRHGITSWLVAWPEVRIASIPHLIEMKQRSGRPRDLEDIDKLRQILVAGRDRPQ